MWRLSKLRVGEVTAPDDVIDFGTTDVDKFVLRRLWPSAGRYRTKRRLGQAEIAILFVHENAKDDDDGDHFSNVQNSTTVFVVAVFVVVLCPRCICELVVCQIDPACRGCVSDRYWFSQVYMAGSYQLKRGAGW